MNSRMTDLMKDLLKKAILGPFAQETRLYRLLYICLVLILTIITQVGGILIWPFLSMNPHDIGWFLQVKRFAYPLLSYCIGSQLLLPLISPLWGMEALPCSSDSNLQPLSHHTCFFNRNYINSDALETLMKIERNMERLAPQQPILYLDANFPLPYMHMLPHLNHSKGDSIDLAFFWKNPETGAYAPPPSPIGYGGFVSPEKPRVCHPYDSYQIAGRIALDLRWDYDWLQPFRSNAVLNTSLTQTLMGFLAKQQNVESITLEPHLHPKIGTNKTIANSCKISRHDDHLYVLFR